MNSYLHGLCAKDLLIGPEDQLDFVRMATNYMLELRPNGEVEQTLIDEIIAAAWQLRRVRAMQTEACAGKGTYIQILDDDALQNKLDRLARHQTRIERTFHRCKKELRNLQIQRQNEERPAYQELSAEEIDAEQRPASPASIGISERTQFAAPTHDDGDHDSPTPEELDELYGDFDRLAADLERQIQLKQSKAA